MSFELADEGIILKKKIHKDNQLYLSIFSSQSGKITIWAYGVKKITSRRLSHLETGNYIRFSYRQHNDKFYLKETEIIYAYSKIKSSLEKLNQLYLALFILDRILPENQPETEIFNNTLVLTKSLNNQESNQIRLDNYLSSMLVKLGFITKEAIKQPYFDTQSFIEEIIGRKITKII